MKKSRLMLISGGIFILLILFAVASFLRIAANDFINFVKVSHELTEISGERETEHINFKNFNSLTFTELWDVTISYGEDFQIILTADKGILDLVSIEKDERLINFAYEKSPDGLIGKNRTVSVEITMPDLKVITFNGMGDIRLHDFYLQTLDINNAGASNIVAENVVIDQLNLSLNGTANADMESSKIKNCTLDISGASNIVLNMSGGILDGQISGASIVTYSGPVSEEAVIVKGIGSLIRE